MSEEKFDPIKEFTSLRDSLSKAVEQSVKTLSSAAAGYPAVDVYETGSAVIVRTVPLAGIDPSSIEVSMENNVLTISGTTQPDADIPEDVRYLVRERRFGQFSRSVRISPKVKPEAAQARIRDAVLTITLPRAEDPRPQIIDITPAE